MLLQLILCPILFSFLYQITNIKGLTFKYLLTRSKCDFCQKPIPFMQLVPIFNFIKSHGKTLCCHRQLSKSYIIGELLSIGSLIVLNITTIPVNGAMLLLIYFSLLALALYDIKTFSIPLHIPIIVVITTFILGSFYLLQGCFITLFLHLIFYFCKNCIGYGDILIFALLSFILPFTIFFLILWLTFLIGGCFSIFYIASKRSWKLKLPLVPFIFCAFNMVALFYPFLNMGGN
jgi:leader peptidase (prepilin peptidase)/N-methyltransferase